MKDPSTKRLLQARLLAVVLLVCVALGLVVHQAYIARTGADAPYMDTLRLLGHLVRYRDGGMSLLELWAQGGSAHSGLIFQAILAANASWFDLDVLLANRLTGIVIALVALLLGGSYLADLRRVAAVPPALPILVIIAATGLAFSLSGFELLTLDLGLGLWLKNLLIFILFITHGVTLRTEGGPRASSAVALSAFGVFVVVVCAMGWAYAVVGTIVGIQIVHHAIERRVPTPAQALLPVTIALALVAVTLWKRWHFGAGNEVAGIGVVAVLKQWPLALAGVFANAEAVAKLGIGIPLLVGLGLILAVTGGLAAAIRLFDRTTSLLPVHLIAYSFLCALSFAVARGVAGDDAVLASRYHMDAFPGVIGLLWIASMSRPGEPRTIRLARVSFVGALFIVLGWFQFHQARIEWAVAPYRKASVEAMKTALLQGVPGEAEANLLQSPLSDARLAARIMRREHLSVFRQLAGDPGLATCSVQWRLSEGWHERESSGLWSSARSVFYVPPCECSYEVRLYIPPNFAPRSVLVSRDGEPGRRLSLLSGVPVMLSIPPSSVAAQYSLQSSRTTVPARQGGSADIRPLGVFMGNPQLSCAGSLRREP